MGALATLFLLACGGTDPGDDPVPELGRYTFTAQWDGGSATGEIRVTAASFQSVDYDFTIGSSTRQGGANWDQIEGFELVSPDVEGYQLRPRFRRDGNDYPCSGTARRTLSTTPMQCAFQYRGQ